MAELSCSKQRGDTPFQATSISIDAQESAAPAAPLASATGSTSTHATGWHGTYKSTAGDVYVPPDWKIDFTAALSRLITAVCIGLLTVSARSDQD